MVVVVEVAPSGTAEVVFDVVAPTSAWSPLLSVGGSMLANLWVLSCNQFAPPVVVELSKASCPSPFSAEVGGSPLGDSVFRHC